MGDDLILGHETRIARLQLKLTTLQAEKERLEGELEQLTGIINQILHYECMTGGNNDPQSVVYKIAVKVFQHPTQEPTNGS